MLLLFRWLRQPLVDERVLNKRLDIVELFVSCSTQRDSLRDVGLKAIPDLDTVISK